MRFGRPASNASWVNGLFVCLLFASGMVAHAQVTAIKVSLSFAPQDPDRLTKGFSIGVTGKDLAKHEAELTNADNWQIYYRGSRVPVRQVKFNAPTDTVDMNCDCVGVPSYRDLHAAELAVSYIAPGRGPVVASYAPAQKGGRLSFVKDAKSADMSLTGDIQTAVSASPLYEWNVNAAYPVGISHYGTVSPSITSKASQETNADPDSSKASATFGKVIAFKDSYQGFVVGIDLIGYEFERKPKQEAVLVNGVANLQNYEQKNTNLVWADTIKYALPGVLRELSIEAGTEYGHSVTRSVRKTGTTVNENFGILRSLAGVDLYQNFFWHCPSKKRGCDASDELPRISFDGHYLLRSPFIAEPYKQTYVNSGNEFLATKPRHYAALNASIPLNTGLNLTIGYQYGSLPPTFTFLDNQTTVGLQILLKHN